MLNSSRVIVEDDQEHSLRLFRERDTGVIRLQASMHTGKLEGTPIWTAFITHQIHLPGWASCVSARAVLLTGLQQFIFSDDYNPPNASTGEFELTFRISSGTVPFQVDVV